MPKCYRPDYDRPDIRFDRERRDDTLSVIYWVFTILGCAALVALIVGLVWLGVTG